MADVEKRTIISPQLDPSGVEAGAKRMGDALTQAASKMAAASDTVATTQDTVTRRLAGSQSAFNKLAAEMVNGYREALNYAKAIQDLQRFVDSGRDRLNLYGTVLTGINAKFGVTSAEAQKLALAMIAPGNSAAASAARLEASSKLLALFQTQARATSVELDKLRTSLGLTGNQAQKYAEQMALVAEAQQKGAITLREAQRLQSVSSVQTGQFAGTAVNAQLGVQRQVNQAAGVLPAPTALGSANRQADLEAAFGAGFTEKTNAARASIDSVFAASKQYEDELKRIDQVVQQLGLDEAKADAARAQATARFAAANQPLQGAYAARERAAKQAIADAQNEARALDQTRRSVDEVYARSKAYEDQLARITELETAGAGKGGITTQHADALRDQAQAKFKKDIEDADKASKGMNRTLGETAGVTAGATREFIVLGHEVLVGNFSRIPGSLLVLTERMGGLRDALVGVIKWVLTPVGAAVAGFLAVAAAFGYMAVKGEEANRQLNELRNTFRGTRDDFDERAKEVRPAAHQLALQANLSTADATAAVTTIAQNPAFQGTSEQLVALGKLSADLAKVIGGDLTGATKLVVEGFDNAGEAAQKLLDEHHLKGLNQAVVDNIKNIQALRGAPAAFEELRKAIESATAGADKLTHLQQSWLDFTRLVTGDGPGIFTRAGQNIANGLGYILDALNAIIKAWEKLRGLIGTGEDTLNDIRQHGVVGIPGASQGSGTAASGNNLVGLRPVGATTGFQSFASPEDSITAGIRQLQINQDQHGLNTLAEQITRWAPASENKTAEYIARVAKETGLDPNAPLNTHDQEVVRRVIAAIAGVETGHKIDQGVIDKGVTGAFAGGPTSPSGIGTTSQGSIDKASALSGDALSVRIQKNQADQAELQRGIDAALEQVQKATAAGDQEGIKAGTAAAIRYAQELDTLRGRATDLITEQEKLARSAQDATKPLEAEAGATRDLATIENEFRIAARAANGGVIDQTSLTAAQNAKLKELSLTFSDTIKEMDRQTNSQNALTAVTEIGGDALDHAQHFERALIEARKTAAVGTDEYKRQVVALTDALDRESEAKGNLQAAQGIHELELETEQLSLQVKLLGASNAERNRELAILQARQHLGLSTGDVANPEQQRYIDYAGQVAKYKTEVEQATAANAELEKTAQSAFDALEKGLTEPLKAGETAAQRLKSTVTSVINDILKEVLKLGVVNPLLNTLFGGGRPSFDNIGKTPGPPPGPGGSTLGSIANSLVGGAGAAAGAANDNHAGLASALGNAVSGGMPIDPGTNAMRVVNVDGSGQVRGGGAGGLLGAITGGGGSDNSGASSAGAEHSPTSGGTGSPSSGGGIFGSLFSGIGKLFGGGGSEAGGSGSSGGVLGSIGKLVGNFPGGLLDSVFGKGFYQGGGLIGSMFGSDPWSGGVPTTAGDLSGYGASASDYTDMAPGFSFGSDVPAMHGGGLVGVDPGMWHSPVHPSVFNTASRYHSGLDSDEFAAILQRGERVMTANQNDRLEGMMGAVANGQGGNAGNQQHVHFNISTPDADSFRASQPQIQARAVASLNRTTQRNAR